MAIVQINPADGILNYEAMLNSVIDTYKGKNTLTLTNYDNDSAPQVTAGSIFENGETLFSNNALATPTGYAGISNSTTFYIYLDVDPTPTFIFSSTAPTWSDAKQGWYNGDDRAYFSMYKDSGGTLYGNKIKLSDNGDISKRTKVIEIGDWNMDTTNTITVAHGLVDFTKVRELAAMIRADGGAPIYSYTGADTGGNLSGIIYVDATNVTMARTTGGLFDNATFDSTSFNRGWIEIVYET